MRMKIWGSWFGIILGLLIVFSPSVRAQNPVPLINQPLVPTTAAPGGPSFTLVVNGTGFVSGSVVNWNGSARVTTFVSGSQLKAAITAADIALAATASVTVSSPAPGGAVSNVEFFQITSSAASVALSRSNVQAGAGARCAVAADFNGDGKLDLAVCHDSGGNTISVLLGNGDGTFQAAANYPSGTDTTHLAVGDFNGDGKLDLIATNGGDNTVSILLGNGDGTFQARTNYSTGTFPIAVGTGDFNGDGKLDLVVTNASANTVSILLGNGDGTFQAHTDYATGTDPQGVFVGDFNGDGKLDIATENISSNSVSILLGNGDGTFKTHVDYAVGSFPQWIAGADVNGDGKLDLLTANTMSSSVSVLLGNGDGTFQSHVDYSTAADPTSVAVGDLNGDGKVDLVTADCLANTCQNPSSISILLGNGDGTFQTHSDFTTGFAPLSIFVGDFNGDGRLDIATANQGDGTLSLFLQTAVFSAASIAFNGQLIGTAAPSQSITLSNTRGSTPLTISSIAITGADSADFTETNTCPASPATLAAGSNCSITVTFQPEAAGSRNAVLTITDNASATPQTVSLTGTGTDFSLSAATGSNCPSGGNCSTSATVSAGQTATYNLQVGPVSGFNGTVTLGCTDALAKSTCAVSPTSVTVNGTTATAFTVTVTTTASSTLGPLSTPTTWRPPLQPMLNLPILFALALLLAGSMVASRHSSRRLLPISVLLIVSLVWIASCGGGGSNGSGGGNPGTPSGTVTITGTSSGVNHSTSLDLTVN